MQTCPLLLRVFCSMGRHHSLMEYARGNTPTNELQIYTWYVPLWRQSRSIALQLIWYIYIVKACKQNLPRILLRKYFGDTVLKMINSNILENEKVRQYLGWGWGQFLSSCTGTRCVWWSSEKYTSCVPMNRCCVAEIHMCIARSAMAHAFFTLCDWCSYLSRVLCGTITA